jgi:hypothetical protein
MFNTTLHITDRKTPCLEIPITRYTRRLSMLAMSSSLRDLVSILHSVPPLFRCPSQMSNVVMFLVVPYKGCLNLFTPMSEISSLVNFRTLLAKGCSFFPEKCLRYACCVQIKSEFISCMTIAVHCRHLRPLSFADVRLVTTKDRNDDSC